MLASSMTRKLKGKDNALAEGIYCRPSARREAPYCVNPCHRNLCPSHGAFNNLSPPSSSLLLPSSSRFGCLEMGFVSGFLSQAGHPLSSF